MMPVPASRAFHLMVLAYLIQKLTIYLRNYNNLDVLRRLTPIKIHGSTVLLGANHSIPNFKIDKDRNNLPLSLHELLLLVKSPDSFFVGLTKDTRTSDFLCAQLPHTPSFPIRLAPYLHTWSHITSDSWVLDIVTHGYMIEFHSIPPENTPVSTTPSPPLLEEISSLLHKDAIEQVTDPSTPGFHSRYFPVPKKDGGLRPILDLRDLNLYISPRKFRMASLDTIIPLLQWGDWFVVIDLKDAYFHISIAPSHRRFLLFGIQHNIYQFKSLPFGLSTAPRVFTKCMAPVITYLQLCPVFRRLVTGGLLGSSGTTGL